MNFEEESFKDRLDNYSWDDRKRERERERGRGREREREGGR